MQRDDKIDVIKGIGIILVVLGHSGFAFSNYIYLFHMALFFAVAGYCFNDKHSENGKSLMNFTLRRIKSLYVPYVLLNILFVVMNNVFIQIHFYSTNAEVVNNSPVVRLAREYQIKDFFKEITSTIVFRGVTQLSGTFWFFKALFCASIIFALSRCLIRKIKKQDIKNILEIIMLVAMIILGKLLYIKGINAWNMGTACSMYAIMLFGYKMKQHIKVFENIEGKIVVVVTFAILLLLNGLGSITLDINEYPNSLFMCIASISGFLLVYYIAKFVNSGKNTKRLLCYIGKRSIVIMCFHLVAFKLVNCVQVLIYNKPQEYIAAFPVLKSQGAWWIIYTITGVIVPLGIEYIYNWFTIKIRGVKSEE